MWPSRRLNGEWVNCTRNTGLLVVFIFLMINPFTLRAPGWSDNFANILKIKQVFEKYLNESCWCSSAEQSFFKYFLNPDLIHKISAMMSDHPGALRVKGLRWINYKETPFFSWNQQHDMFVAFHECLKATEMKYPQRPNTQNPENKPNQES